MKMLLSLLPLCKATPRLRKCYMLVLNEILSCFKEKYKHRARPLSLRVTLHWMY